jgi:hypothetical protein
MSTSWVPTQRVREEEEKMLKLTASLISGALALCLPLTVLAEQKAAPPPPRILVTYQVLEVPGDTTIPVTDTQPASEVYKTLMQIPSAEATEISLQTPAGFPGTVRYNRVLTFSAQDHGKPTRVFLDLPMSLEATPHINPDGTITVQIKTEITHAAPTIGDEVPLINGESWQSKQTFKNGEIRLFAPGDTFTSMRLFAGNDPKTLAKNKELIALQNKVFVPFVTVTVLPSVR